MSTSPQLQTGAHSHGDWQAIIEFLPDAALVVDDAGKIVLHNQAAETLLGYAQEEFRELCLQHLLFDAKSLQPLNEHKLHELIASGASRELVVRHKDFLLLPALFSMNYLGDPADAQTSLRLGVLRDIRSLKQAQSRVDDEKKRFEIVVNNINEAVFLAPITPEGVHGNFVEVNDAACQRLGYTREELLNMNARTLNPAANLDKVKAFGRHIKREGNTIFEAIHVAKDGTQFPVEVVAKVIAVDGQDYVLSVVRDLREHRRLQQTETRFGRLIDHSWEEIYIFDSQSLHFLQVNQGALDNLGYSRKEIQNLKVTDIKPELSEADFERLTRPLLDGSRGRIIFETVHQRADGSRYPVEIRLQMSHSEVPPVFLANVQDITERKKSEDRLQYLANYDSLTGLPNRTLFFDRLNMALENSKRTDTLTGLIYLDLDGFKDINDTMGHAVGDKLLKEISGRLLDCARKSDTVARLGGDEFTVIVSNLKTVDGVEVVAQKIIETIALPIVVDGQEMHISTSLGITLYPFKEDDDAYALVKQADAAMYHAKKIGKNNYQFYTAQLWQREIRRVRLENALKVALAHDEFRLVYQPRIELRTTNVIGVEALLRWTHPDLGAISPAEFIPLLEANRQIHDVGIWVLTQACRQLRHWLKKGIDLRMSVNVSACQLEYGGFAEQVRVVLADNEIEPGYLELEITEGVLLSQSEKAVAALQAVKAMGVRISLDDFGSGYSSLHYLKRFAIDILKIDRSFVMDLNNNSDSEVIVNAIIGLAESLNLQVTAEGIETKLQKEYLQNLGCHEGQGFYFAKPIEPEAIERLIADELSPAS
jgi:diguanylate cyclase (GGDEF)-like protein/PAS domain S-box-containing protein